jgi:ABC-type transporter Mla subunit MlaD
MSNRSARNNLLAGLFVVVSLVVAVWVSFLLSDRSSMAGMTRFTVRFSLEDGATGLKRGSPVLLGGQQVGRVRSVRFARDPAGKVGGVDVGVEVRADLTLAEDAGVYLQLPLLGTLSSINISSVGTAAAPALDEGDVVFGRLAPPAFLAQAGFGSEQAAQLRASLTAMESAINRVAQLVETGGPKVEASLNDAQRLLADLRERLAAWSQHLDKTAANIEEASGRLNPMLTSAESTVAEARETIGQMRTLVADNRERLGQIITNLESATAKLDGQTIDRINAAVEQGRGALEVFASALTRVSTLVSEETPSLRRTLANLRLMSDQLKLTAVEVRSQPWRLLHQPTTKELSTQVLYDSTRAYAEAASDLRAAAEAVQVASANPAHDLTALTEQLGSAMSKYRQAEQALMDKLIEGER